MRNVFVVLLLAAFLPRIGAAPAVRPPVTLLLAFDRTHSDATVEEMKAELSKIMGEAGMTFDYKLRSELNESDTPSDIIVVRFTGSCAMSPAPVLFDERGPYAITHTSDGEVLPFSEVACDRVKVSIRSAMWGGDFSHADRLLGRALGRVLAHEIYHMVARTGDHGAKGVARRALSPRELIAERLVFDDHDLRKLQR